jgi:membrane dipeptidase
MDRTEIYSIFDGHNDTLLRLYQAKSDRMDSFFSRGDRGHIDLPRAIEGGFGGGFFAMFVPAKKDHSNSATSQISEQVTTSDWDASHYLPLDYAQKTIADMIALLRELEKEAAGKFKVVHTAEELSTCLRSGTVAAVMHMEGAEAIEPNLNNLSEYYEAGLRSLGITWSRSNVFGHGVPFEYPSSPDTGPGLTAAGRNLVKACNRLGIMLDLSHLNEKGFWEVASLSDAPLVATHSGVHALCPASRNLTDRQLEAIADSHGVVGINFYVAFLRADGKNDPKTPISDIVRHVDYVVQKIGIDHVAFGSDFDGATMPISIRDVTGFPKLTSALEKHGYGDQALKQIAHRNWLRVLKETWHS